MLFLAVAVLLLLGDAQLHVHGKFGADPLDGAHRDPAVHHVHDIFGDCQPQAGPAVHRGGAGGLLGEGLENVGNELLAHTHAGVVYNKTQHGIVLRFLPLGGREGDLSALAREFDGVAENVDEHLLQLHGIAHVVVVQHRVCDALVVHPLGSGLGVADRVDSVQELLGWNLFIFQQHFAALDPAHIQDIIDQGKQESGRYSDLGDAVLHLFIIPNGPGRYGTHADNGVHRRPYLVAHAGEEVGFGGIRLLRSHQRGGQLLLLALLLADHVGHVGPRHTHPLQLPADVEYLNPLDPQTAVCIAHLHAERVGRLMLQLS